MHKNQGLNRLEILFLTLFCLFIVTESKSQVVNLDELKSFPTAEGYGRYTGTNMPNRSVYYVTNLNDAGAGSLREGLSQSNRVILFKVSGTITLHSSINVTSDNIYIAGQTAFQNGGEGITLRSDGVQNNNLITVFGNHVIVRYIRFRRGPDGPSGSVAGDNLDFLDADDWIVDHCSLSWSTDENIAAGNSVNGTMQYCISSEGLYFSTHWYSIDPNNSTYQTGHSKGAIFGWDTDLVDSLSFYRNYFAHNDGRNPRIFGPGSTIEIVNNLLYNNRYFNIEVSASGIDTMKSNIVKNLLIPGKDTRLVRHMVHSDEDLYNRIYMLGNIGIHRSSDYQAEWLEVGKYGNPIGDTGRSLTPFNTPLSTRFATLPKASLLDDLVLSDVGASLKWDAVDLRVISDAKNLTPTVEKTIVGTDPNHWNGSLNYFGIINDPSEVGGWPVIGAMDSIVVDTNNDGIADSWAQQHGVVNWNDVLATYTFDGLTVNNIAGYTAREIYLSYLADDFQRLLPISIAADGENCDDALEIPGTGYYYTDGPSNGFGCHNCADASHADWWKFTAPSDGMIDIYSCFGGSDTRLFVYSGDCGNLQPLGSSDDDCLMDAVDNYASELLAIPVTQGTTYFIEWDNSWDSKYFYFSFEFTATIGCAEKNRVHVDLQATGNGSGCTWENALTNLQDAIDYASTNPEIQEIWVKEGLYVPGNSSTLPNRNSSFSSNVALTLFGGFAGTELSLNRRREKQHLSILSGDIGLVGDITDNCYSVVNHQPSQALTLDGFMILGGNANASGSVVGAGVHNEGTLSLKNTNVRNQNGSSSASAVLNERSEALMTIENVVIEGNDIHDFQNDINSNVVIDEYKSLIIRDSVSPPISFPTAYGAGAAATGGRGKPVYKVTNLENDGDGSFRQAILDAERSDGGNIIFDVSGVINLTGALNVQTSNLTIAGQTAPEGGITFTGAFFSFIECENLIIRYIKARSILDTATDPLRFIGCNNVMVDHCSFSWGGDECFSTGVWVTDSLYNFTIQKCIFAESNTGVLFGASSIPDMAFNISCHNNLFYNVSHRMPNINTNGRADVINNVSWNWFWRMTYAGGNVKLNHFNNYYGMGERTGLGGNQKNVNVAATEADWNPRIYAAGTYIDKGILTDLALDNKFLWYRFDLGQQNVPLLDTFFVESAFPLLGNPLPYQSATEAFETLKSDVGSNKYFDNNGEIVFNLDSIDSKYIEVISAGEGSFETYATSPETFSQQANYIAFHASATNIPYNIRPATYDADHDGIPDAWEIKHGMNPNAPNSDGDIDWDGYTDLEEFLNSIDE